VDAAALPTVTGPQSPVINHRSSVTGHQSPVISHQPSVTGHQAAATAAVRAAPSADSFEKLPADFHPLVKSSKILPRRPSGDVDHHLKGVEGRVYFGVIQTVNS
jgi:hypothetical protein